MAGEADILHHEAILLLPGAVFSSFTLLKAAYEAPLSQVLSTLTSGVKGTQKSAVLDIAVAVSGFSLPNAQLRSQCFDHLQHLLANIYRLVGVVSVKCSVDLDGPGGVDARVFFVSDIPMTPIESQVLGPPQIGPVISLNRLVVSGRRWDSIYSIDSPQGESFLSVFMKAAKPNLSNSPMPCRLTGTNDKHPPSISIGINPTHSTPHYSVAVGGTFDHLHAGHKLLLEATVLPLNPYVELSPQKRIVTIGITGDEMLVNKKYSEFLESWEQRWRGVWVFLQSIVDFSSPADRKQTKIERISDPGPNGKRVIVSLGSSLEFRFVQISDPFGPTITDQDITALVVSKETRAGGKAVNEEREEKGWPILEVFEVDVLDLSETDAERSNASTETFDSKISSTEIRRRRMNLAKGSPSL